MRLRVTLFSYFKVDFNRNPIAYVWFIRRLSGIGVLSKTIQDPLEYKSNGSCSHALIGDGIVCVPSFPHTMIIEVKHRHGCFYEQLFVS